MILSEWLQPHQEDGLPVRRIFSKTHHKSLNFLQCREAYLGASGNRGAGGLQEKFLQVRDHRASLRNWSCTGCFAYGQKAVWQQGISHYHVKLNACIIYIVLYAALFCIFRRGDWLEFHFIHLADLLKAAGRPDGHALISEVHPY